MSLRAERLEEKQSQSTDITIATLREHQGRTFRFSTRRCRERFIGNDN
ncbi:hypothetical protein [Nostoc sp.]